MLMIAGMSGFVVGGASLARVAGAGVKRRVAGAGAKRSPGRLCLYESLVARGRRVAGAGAKRRVAGAGVKRRVAGAGAKRSPGNLFPYEPLAASGGQWSPAVSGGLLRIAVAWLAACVLLLGAEKVAATEPIISGYADDATLRRQMEQLAASPFARLESLGRTLGGREVLLLRIGTGKMDSKPAVLIVGGIHAPQLLGSRLALETARRLVEQAESEREGAQLLRSMTFYVIPRPAPDASEAFFQAPYAERSVNLRPMDDDGDGPLDEDGPEDLNGDGWITMMRIDDTAGPFMAHPAEPRVLIEADPKRNEQGRWRVLVEGRDNDQDGALNEDPPGGVAFDRNFTFQYPYFEPGAGPHQVSEVETRAVADFAFSHPNIAVVISFGLQDNLVHPWKPDASAEKQQIKTSVLSADAGYYDYVAEQYRELFGVDDPGDAPDSPPPGGSFCHWAYYHYGRWSFAARGWWIPRVEAPASASEAEAEGDGDEPADDAQLETDHDADLPANDAQQRAEEQDETAEGAKPDDEKRGADEVNALRWFEQQGIEGFVEWQPVEHPDFPDRKVEVGGFKPFLRLNPPEDQLDSLAEKHHRFVCCVAGLLPRLEITDAQAEALPGGVWRVRAVVVNRGYLPTMARMGEITGEPHALQAELVLPQGTRLVSGHARVRLPRLEGSGGKAEQAWLVLVPDEKKPTQLKLRVWGPAVGQAVRRIRLEPASDES